MPPSTRASSWKRALVRRERRCGWLLLVGASLFCSRRAWARDDGLSVHFTAPPECGSAGVFENRARGLLGAGADRARVRVDARITSEAGAYELTMTLTGEIEGRRALRASSCANAIEAGALILALSIDPTSLDNGTAPDDGQAPADPDADDMAPRADVDAPADEPRDLSPAQQRALLRRLRARKLPTSGPRAFVAAALMSGQGLVPGAGLGPRLGFGLAWRNLALELYGFHQPSHGPQQPPAGRVRLLAWGGQARACWLALQLHEVNGGLCAGIGLNRVSAEAVDLEQSSGESALLYTPMGSAVLRWAVWEHLGVMAEAGVQMPTTRPRFVVRQQDESLVVFEPKSGLLTAIGIETWF